jgi:hypothetical protein
LDEIEQLEAGKGITRFISTHPDLDHILGLTALDDRTRIVNFYCVENEATKADETDDFTHYCGLRGSKKAFYLYAGCKRKWLNERDDDRESSGFEILWPKLSNPDYQAALEAAKDGDSANDICPIIKYSLKHGASACGWATSRRTS